MGKIFVTKIVSLSEKSGTFKSVALTVQNILVLKMLALAMILQNC